TKDTRMLELLCVLRVLCGSFDKLAHGLLTNRLPRYHNQAPIKENPYMLGIKLDVRPFLERVGQELSRVDPVEVKALADAIFVCYQERRMVFVCGNGGSGSNASHFCEDMGKCTLRREDYDNDKKKRLRILSLTDNTPYILAWANDEGFERVFAEQLKNLASPG